MQGHMDQPTIKSVGFLSPDDTYMTIELSNGERLPLHTFVATYNAWCLGLNIPHLTAEDVLRYYG